MPRLDTILSQFHQIPISIFHVSKIRHIVALKSPTRPSKWKFPTNPNQNSVCISCLPHCTTDQNLAVFITVVTCVNREVPRYVVPNIPSCSLISSSGPFYFRCCFVFKCLWFTFKVRNYVSQQHRTTEKKEILFLYNLLFSVLERGNGRYQFSCLILC